ncbi:alpha/beta fold hydrolase [Frankia sp. AgB32]|uniref:alpha/beta fold hydrolase n=1 Tax=Frankia sp. AgB32 TaxID=631119 RepID=UPI00200FCE4E|nr:alpha/beta hydrolase [Frankia sp. AgB32]MCK9895969.1 alpha/beta fold hydrolase [Frankia sp. AgB32]
MTVSFARNSDVRIAYETFGAPDGVPLLLIMGLTFQMPWWPDGFCQHLADRGFAVARFDNRDAGLSTHFPAPRHGTVGTLLGRRGRPAYRMEDMVADAVAVLDALHWDSAHLLGESLGATLAQLVAIQHPDRVRGLVSAMAGGTGGAVSNLRNVKIGTLFRLASKRYDDTRDGGVQRLVDTYMIMCSAAHPVDKAWVRATAELSWDRDHDPGATGRQLAASRTAGDIRAQLRQLRTPTLVIHGEQDPWIRPRAARELAAAVPDARLITYPGMGHEFPEHLWSTIARDVWETTTRDAASHARAAPRP